ncbi:hypothetical protein H0H93_011965 [Arthromyces matolae]|nr:hypothetical protein H0H93_011965 [Arthromyces matolae]
MSSTIIVLGEQEPSFVFTVPRFTVYSIAVGLFAVVLHWLYQNQPTTKRSERPVEQSSREIRSSSVSSEATLVEVSPVVDAPKPKDDEAEIQKEKDTPVESPKHDEKPAPKSGEYFSQQSPFTTLSLSVKDAVAKGRPTFERRVSLPARRLSSHVVSALHHISPHHHHAADSTSPQDADKKTSESEPEKQQPKVAVAENEKKAGSTTTPKKPVAFRQVVRRASIAFGISHRS